MITTAISRELVAGAVDLEKTDDGVLPHRLPGWARAQFTDPQLSMVESQPSGVRVQFRTAATVIELETRPTKREYPACRRGPTAATTCSSTTSSWPVRRSTAAIP